MPRFPDTDFVRHAVVVAERALGRIVPPVGTQCLPLGMARIKDQILRFRCFANHEKTDFLLGIVEKTMGNSGARRKTNRIARLQTAEFAIQPDIGRALDDVDELLFRALGMRERCPPPRQEALVMNADPAKPEMPSESRVDGEQFVITLVVVFISPFDLGPMRNTGRPVFHCHVKLPMEQTARTGRVFTNPSGMVWDR